ncbi:MAG: PDZ domain-containing protein [Candidatus Bipolaricaulota bacterium]
MVRRVLIAVLAAALVAVAASAAVDTRYVRVDVEVFRPLGFLGIGWFEPLDVRFLSMDIERLADADVAAVGQAAAACGDGLGDASTCERIADVAYIFTRRYAMEPVVGAMYRVVLTNLTEMTLGVVLAIDGLNTNGSEPVAGTSADRKWILDPNQSVRVAGWQVSSDEALRFRFETPSAAHAPLPETRGQIEVHVYLPDPRGDVSRGTGAGRVIDQPTVPVAFASLTSSPVDLVRISYARTSVSLGVLCEDNAGTGVRIREIVAGTIAELRGLQAGDVVTYVNAVPVNSCEEFAAAVASRQPGERVVLKVHRAERSFLLTLELEE